MTSIIADGDPNRNKTQCVPGDSSLTIKIELPADWDTLMAERGCRPLEEVFL